MKKITFVLLFSLISVFAFSQSVKKPISLKEKTIKVVEYLDDVLALDEKQEAIFMSAFSEYANEVMIAEKKLKKKYKPEGDGKIDKRAYSKELNLFTMRLSDKRNDKLKSCLKKKQLKSFEGVIKNIHPVSFAIRGGAKK
tara:strand:- start:86 stop:505 length:420 start_codon:yes stop_codon:yes gene_type:complete